MFKSTTRTLGVLGGIVAMILVVGIGLVTGVVPGLAGSSGSVGAEIEASATTATPADTIAVPTTEAPAPTTPPTTVAVAAVVKTSPTTRAAAAKVVAPPVEAPAAGPSVPATPAPTVPALAARTVPSSGQVQSAISGLNGLVQLPFGFQIQPSNVADVGNRVCTAFDQGQSFAQVKSTGLSMVSAYVPVSDAAADYAVRKAVELYCPGYAYKLA